MSGAPDPRECDPLFYFGRKGVFLDGFSLRPCASAKWYTPGSGTGKERNEKELRRTGELPGAIGYNVASSYGRESMAGIETIRKETKRLADPEKAKILQRFFKTGPGQYGEGDVFAGITVPVIRKLVRKHRTSRLRRLPSCLGRPFTRKGSWRCSSSSRRPAGETTQPASTSTGST